MKNLDRKNVWSTEAPIYVTNSLCIAAATYNSHLSSKNTVFDNCEKRSSNKYEYLDLKMPYKAVAKVWDENHYCINPLMLHMPFLGEKCHAFITHQLKREIVFISLFFLIQLFFIFFFLLIL